MGHRRKEKNNMNIEFGKRWFFIHVFKILFSICQWLQGTNIETLYCYYLAGMQVNKI